MLSAKIFKNSLGQEFCTVHYSPATQMVKVIWNGGVTRERVRQVREWILSLLEETQCHLMLNDMQELIIVSSDEYISWLKEEWDVKAYDFGLRFIADIVKEDSIAEVYLKEVKQERHASAADLIIATFNSQFDALHWLIEKRSAYS